MTFKQPERLPTDGLVSVERLPDGRVSISVGYKPTENSEHSETLRISEFNASRVLAALALVLGVRLNAKDAKEIKL